MSGLEIVALVPAIISAYCAASSEYKAWRTRKKKRAKEAQNTALQTSLDNSGTIIQSQYKLDVQHLGPVFEKGDEIGCSALKDQLIILQNSVIALLVNTKKSDTLVNLVHPNHDILWSKSNGVRGNIITALAEQYQRIQQKKPVQKSLPAPPMQKADGISVQVVPKTPGMNCRGIIKYDKRMYSCEVCLWQLWELNKHEYDMKMAAGGTTDGKTIGWFHLTRIFHHVEAQDSRWRCDMCKHQPVLESAGEIMAHCKYFHTLADILAKPKEDVVVEEEFVKDQEGGKFEGATKEGGNSRKSLFLSLFTRPSPRRNLEMRGVQCGF